MANFGELIAKVSLRLKDPNNTAISSATVSTALNDAIQHWSKRRFFFNEFEETIELVENDPFLPDLIVTAKYFFNPNGMVINFANTRWTVKRVSPQEYDQMNVEGRGIPFAYCARNKKFELYYFPDNPYSTVIRGVRSYTEFATDGTDNNNSNDFTTDAPDLIMYEATSRLFAEIYQDPKMETYFTARTQKEYISLTREDNRVRASGRLTVEGF